MTLVRYTSCGDALRNLRAAASNTLAAGLAAQAGGAGYPGAASGTGSAGGTSGAPSSQAGAVPAAAPRAAQEGANQAAGASVPGEPGTYSGTNTAEAGVDEPDLVKTDGRRIVTVSASVLRVVDVATRRLTGVLDLSEGIRFPGGSPANLLLAGNHALVLFDQFYPVTEMPDGPVAVSPPAAGVPGQAGSGQAGSPGTGSAGGAGGTITSNPAESGGALGQPSVMPMSGPRLLLIDLSAPTPRLLSQYAIDGALVDTRQVGSVARVVVHSVPRLMFPSPAMPGLPPESLPAQTLPGGQIAPGAQYPTTAQGAAAYRAMVASAPVSAWLPRYAVTAGGVWRTGQVDCAAMSHPAAATYSGTSMLTVLTFDLSGGSLGDGSPLTVVADGDTVYSNGASLYIANNGQWNSPPTGMLPLPGAVPQAGAEAPQAGVAVPQGGAAAAGTAPPTATAQSAGTGSPAAPQQSGPLGTPPMPVQYTGIYKFDISGPGRPVYEAAGTVPGWLLGSSTMAQYALSEWNGALRVATTSGDAFSDGSPQPTQSAVYVLQQVGDQLVIVGKVGGLGQGEQIYAVRFAGPAGYVVTFRQTDPLYTLDLSDPAQPRVAGELLLRGYSAFLDPIDATHLIGVGQDANTLGQTQGTQISLFDVSDLAAPVRLAVFHLQFAHSEAEFDPHAFLYWPASRLLVIPVQVPTGMVPMPAPGTGPQPQGAEALWPRGGAVVLHVGDHTITQVGIITHPDTPDSPGGGQIRRSLVIGDGLWTVSDTGLKANDLATLALLGWVPFT